MLGATTEVAVLKKALSEAEDRAASECKEREKQSVRVGEVTQASDTLHGKVPQKLKSSIGQLSDLRCYMEQEC